MEKRNTEWYKQRAREKREREAGRRSYHINCQRRDLKELEALKNRLLKEDKKRNKAPVEDGKRPSTSIHKKILK